ncbi:MAG: PAS domain S-box protein [Anaerolineales bacterium]|nr:PAS domain S-box protein [Anaerolineales bacterium]
MSDPNKNPQNNSKREATGSFRYEKKILNTSSIGVLIARINDGTILFANKAINSLLGIADVTSIIGQPVSDFYSDSTNLQEMLELFRAKGSVASSETRVRQADGNMKWVSISLQPFEFEGEQTLLAEIVDITSRKQSEDAVKASQQKLSLLIDSSPLAVIEWNTNFEVISWNRAAERIFGYSFEEAKGRHAAGLIVPAEYKAVVDDVWANLLKQTGGTRSTNGNVTKDGRAITCEWYNTPLAGADGNVFGVSSLVEDVTESKLAEEKALQLQSAVEQTGDGIALADLNGNVLYANPAWAEMHGYIVDKILGKHLSIFHTQEQLEQEVIPFNNKVMEFGKYSSEIGHARKDGSTFPTLMTTVVQKDENGTPVGLIGTIRDITERKQLEHEVQEGFERRGYQVQVSTEISQEVAAATKLDELFERVVTLTKERLGYYHTQLLRYDPAQDSVVLINGYGETGKKMLASGHKMPLGAGLIGTAAESGQTVMRPTLAEDPDWQPNPLLPDTQGEIAVPIKLGDQILGVLDVQSNQAGALTEDDRLLLEGICGQVGIAMRSAELVKTIRENEARLAEALKIARLGNWEYDFENDLFHFTDEFYSIFRTTAEKVGGYKISSADYSKNFVHPDDAPLVGSEIQKVLDAKDRLFTTHLEHRIIFSDGEVGYIAVNINVERDEDGKITRWYGANQDITERKQAEEALRVNEARLAEALKTARLANWEYDVEKDLFTFNDQFYSIFHTTAEKAGGYQLPSARYAELFVHPDDMEVVGMEIGKALSSTERVYNTSLDHRFLYQDGGGVGYITVKLTVERDENGKITRYFGANQDITERIKQQNEMAERLEEINHLYRAMSHEGWNTYRKNADLPEGFVFDQEGTRPVNEETVDEGFANIPMRVLGGEVVGTLTVADDPKNPTSAEDYAFFQEVSDQIALALEGARLSAQTQSALAQSEKLFEASRKLTQVTDLQELVKTAVEIFDIPVINGAELNLFSYDSSGDLESLSVIANWWNNTGTAPGAIGSRFAKEMFSAVKLFLTPTPVFISDVLDSELGNPGMMRFVKSFNIRAVTFLPLFIGTNQIGVLVMHAEEAHEFTEEETRLFSGLAPQIATVLENRRQYQEAQNKAERESTLNVISQKIQSATTVEAVLQIAARELGHALGAPMTVAQLNMKDKQ